MRQGAGGRNGVRLEKCVTHQLHLIRQSCTNEQSNNIGTLYNNDQYTSLSSVDLKPMRST